MAQKKDMKKGKMSAGKIVAVTAGVAALGAGAYYLLGPNGKKNQKKVKAVITKIEKKIEKKAAPMVKQAKKAVAKVAKKAVKVVKKATKK